MEGLSSNVFHGFRPTRTEITGDGRFFLLGSWEGHALFENSGSGRGIPQSQFLNRPLPENRSEANPLATTLYCPGDFPYRKSKKSAPLPLWYEVALNGRPLLIFASEFYDV